MERAANTNGNLSRNFGKSIFTTQALSRIALLGAVSWVLTLFYMPLPFMPPWLDFEISDLPAVLGTFAMGPVAGVIIEAIKNVLHMMVTRTAFVGELANFLICSSLIIPAGLIYRKMHTKRGALLSLAIGTLSLSVVAVLLNYFFLFPMYATAMGLDLVAIMQSVNPNINSIMGIVLLGVVPFNIIKCVVLSVLTMLLYKPLAPLLKVKI